jgi:iron complex outermembrane receptor protein
MYASGRRRGLERAQGVRVVRAATNRHAHAIPFTALLLATTAVLPLLVAAPAMSQVAAGTTFNIPAGDLGSVLAQIGRTASQPISFPADLTRGRTAGPVVGRMSVREALARALAGSGLVAVPGAGGALTIRGATAPTAGAAALGDIAAIDVTDTAGSRDVGFTAIDTQSSTRIDIPLKENPRSVVGVTDAVIRTQAQTSVLDAARNVSNVRIGDGSGQAQGSPTYFIRGFDQSQILINGQPSGTARLPITDIERIDVIKGPTTELSGPSFNGGAINAVTKAPTATPIRRADVFYGSRFFRTLAFDLGGPVSDLEGVTYRLNLSGNTANTSFGGNTSPHEALISPVVSWQGVDTRVTAGMRYIDRVYGVPPFTFGTPEVGFRPLRLPRETPFGSAANGGSVRILNPYGEIDHHLGTIDAANLGSLDFRFRNRTSYFITDSYSQTQIPGSIIVGYRGGEPLANPVGSIGSSFGERFVTQSDMLVRHDTEYFRQTMRFGIDYLKLSGKQKSNLLETREQIGLFNPRQDLQFPGFFTPSWYGSNFFRYGQSATDNVGISFQDKIDLFDRFHILGSVRQDWYSSKTVGSRRVRLEQAEMTYTAGAVYDIFPWVSVYGSVGTGFLPQEGFINRTEPAPPVLSDLSEVGFKFSLLDNQLMVTVDRYSNAYSNTLFFDPATRTNRLGPGYLAEGYELDFQGQITPNLQVIGGYSYNDFTNGIQQAGTRSSGPLVMPGQPQHQANLFAVYTFTEGPLQGLSIGGGGRGQTFSFTDFRPRATAPKIPGFITYDAMIGYTMENFRVDMNVTNLFDRYYYNTTVSPYFVPLAQGRTFMIRATLDF